MEARALIFCALALRGIDVALDLWARSPQLGPLFWALVLVVIAAMLRTLPRLASFVLLLAAVVSVVNAINVLRLPVYDMDLIVPFYNLRRGLWLGEAAFIVGAAVVALKTSARAVAAARAEQPRAERTPLTIRRPLLIGAACWTAALAVIFWWPGESYADWSLSPLIPLVLLLRFLLARRLGRADAIVARVAGWIGVV